jgi:hypothetical protein
MRKKDCGLPAIAAISTISAITTAATAAATTISTIAAAPTTAVSATASAATRALRLRARFIHHKVPAAKILTVEAGNGAVCFLIIGDFDEGEATRLPSETIAN